MVLTAGPTFSVPVRSLLQQKSSGMSVMAGSASSQHAFVPLGAMAHLFIPDTEAVRCGDLRPMDLRKRECVGGGAWQLLRILTCNLHSALQLHVANGNESRALEVHLLYTTIFINVPEGVPTRHTHNGAAYPRVT